MHFSKTQLMWFWAQKMCEGREQQYINCLRHGGKRRYPPFAGFLGSLSGLSIFYEVEVMVEG